MSKTRKINLICLFAVLVASLFIGTSVGKTVKADATAVEPVTFEMVDGASVRLSDGTVNGKNLTNGMRFQIKMDAKTVASIDGQNVKLYAFIAPVSVVDLTSNDKVAAAAETIKSHKNKWLEIAVNSIYTATDESGKEYYYANAVICNLTSAFYNVQFNAVAIIDNGGVYTYAKAASTTRSIYDVVNSAVLDKYAERLIGDQVATKLDYANWYGTAEYPVAPQTPAQFNKYNELKSTTLKNLSIERQDVMVDNPVVTIDGKEYTITVPEVHGEQDVEVTVEGATVTVPVTIITKEIKTFDELMQSVTARNNEVEKSGAYYTLGNDIDAEGKTIYTFLGENGSTITPEYCDLGNGFAGTLNGKGYKVCNLNLDSSGIFRGMTGAIVKNISFEIANYSEKTQGATLFASNVQDCLFEKVTVTVTKAINMETNNNSGLLVVHQTKGTTFKSVNIIADDSTLTTLVGSGYWSGTAGNNKYENCAVSCLKLNYVGYTIATTDGMDVKTTKTITLTNNQDILLTNKTYAISLGSEGTGLTINSITCNGVDLGTNLSNLDMSAIKRDMTKHGITKVIVKGEKDGNKVTVIAPVTLVTKMIKNQDDLRTVVTTITDSSQKSIFGYYKLESDIINYSGGFYNSTGYVWTNANNGFRGTLDGNGKTITGFAHDQGLFFVVGNGAVIKNVNFISTRWSGSNDRLFGAASYGATYEDVTIIMKSSTTPCAGIPTKHLLFADKCQNNTFTNVTVKVYSDDGITLGDVTTVFGNNFTDNKCSGVKIYCKSLAELGKDSEGVSVMKYENITVHNTEE